MSDISLTQIEETICDKTALLKESEIDKNEATDDYALLAVESVAPSASVSALDQRQALEDNHAGVLQATEAERKPTTQAADPPSLRRTDPVNAEKEVRDAVVSSFK